MQVVVQVTDFPLTKYVCVAICALALIAKVAKMIAIAFFMFTPLLKTIQGESPATARFVLVELFSMQKRQAG